ncbi:hypothetical protein [Streptomyces hygroscopicus]|nr:hypothetical protein [Streptomyces hygroscopicus]
MKNSPKKIYAGIAALLVGTFAAGTLVLTTATAHGDSGHKVEASCRFGCY